MPPDQAIRQLKGSLNFEGRRSLEAGDWDVVEAVIRRGLRRQKQFAVLHVFLAVFLIAFWFGFFRALGLRLPSTPSMFIGGCFGLMALLPLHSRWLFWRSWKRNLETLSQVRPAGAQASRAPV